MSSASLRARSPFFSFDSETGTRRPTWVIFLAGLLSVVLGLAGLAFGVTAANAHDKDYDVSCFGITVKLTNYNTSGQNKVSVVVDDLERVPADKLNNFGQNYTFTYTWDAAAAHSYVITVRGQDGYNLDASGTQQPCAKPTVGLTATECNTTSGLTNLTATASGFAVYGGKNANFPGYVEKYKGVLYQDGAPYKEVTDVQADADGTFTWNGEPAGHTYSWVVTGTTNSGLTASAQAKVIGCPQNSALVVNVNECTSPTTSNGSVTVDASQLTFERAYTVVVKQGGQVIAGPYDVVAQPNGTGSVTIPLSPSLTGLTAEITDTKAGITSPPSKVFGTAACPTDPTTPTVGHQVCNTVGGKLELVVTLGGLTNGRTYIVEVLPSGGGAAVVTQEIVAGGTTQGGLTYPVPPGSYVVKITDKLVPSLAKTSEAVEVKACPTQPDVSLTPTECDAAGGKGEIAVAFTGLGAGREYTVTITENGNAVPGYTTPVTVSLATLPLDPYTNLDPGKTYLVTVVDTAAPTVMDSASIYLELCPMTPTLELDLKCLFLDGDSLITATIDDLVPGEEYDVVVTATTAPPTPIAGGGVGGSLATAVSPASAVAVVATETITGGTDPAAVTFQLPNNVDYTVTVTKSDNAKVTNSASIFAAICDLPTFPLPPELPTLALTGAGDTTLPMLGALGLVQFGVALLALAAMLQFSPRRRLS
jgi:hypothetical protein